jgi:hypothetical protein
MAKLDREQCNGLFKILLAAFTFTDRETLAGRIPGAR